MITINGAAITVGLAIIGVLFKVRSEIQKETADSTSFRAYVQGELKMIAYRLGHLENTKKNSETNLDET